MRYNRKIYALLSILMSATILSACGKSETTAMEPVVMQPVNFSIPYANTFDSAENVAIQYQNYLRNGYWEYAYDLIDVPKEILFNCADLQGIETDISTLPSNWELVKVGSTGSSVNLTYGEKTGEAFSKGSKNEESAYLGDIITNLATITLPLSTSGSKPYMIGVSDKFLSEQSIAVRIPDHADLWIGGKLLDDASRDDNGFYTISDFVGGDLLTIKLGSDIEEKEITLDLTVAPFQEVDITNFDVMICTGEYHKLPAWDIRWETSRLTNNEALSYIPEAVQVVFDSIINSEEFYSANFNKVMSKDANLEELKAQYVRLCKDFSGSKTRDYENLTVISVEPMSEEDMKRKNLAFEILDKHTMRTWVTIKYNFEVHDKSTGEVTVKTNVIEGYVDLSKDDGQWRLMGISEKMLKNM